MRTQTTMFAAVAVVMLIVGCVLSPIVAMGQTIQDPSFETPVIPSNNFTYDPVGAPWSFAANSGIINAPGAGFNGPNAPDGSQYAFLQSGSGGHSPGAFSQTISFTLDGTYQLTYLVAGRPPNNLGAFGNLPYDLRLDSSVIGSDTTTSSEPFTEVNFIFMATAGQHTLTFETTQINEDNTAFIDAVAIRAVPEPTSLVLLALSGAGCMAARLRRRR